jgi:hypothetical protein
MDDTGAMGKVTRIVNQGCPPALRYGAAIPHSGIEGGETKAKGFERGEVRNIRNTLGSIHRWRSWFQQK